MQYIIDLFGKNIKFIEKTQATNVPEHVKHTLIG